MKLIASKVLAWMLALMSYHAATKVLHNATSYNPVKRRFLDADLHRINKG